MKTKSILRGFSKSPINKDTSVLKTLADSILFILLFEPRFNDRNHEFIWNQIYREISSEKSCSLLIPCVMPVRFLSVETETVV